MRESVFAIQSRFLHTLLQPPVSNDVKRPLSSGSILAGAFEQGDTSSEVAPHQMPTETAEQILALQRQIDRLMEDNAILSGLPPPVYKDTASDN